MITQKTITELGEIRSSDGTMLKMWMVQVPPGTRHFRLHSHVAFEIAYINKGNGIYTIHEQNYPMHPGDMFIFSSNEQHCITDIDEDGLVLTNLHFEPRYLWGNSLDRLTENHANFCFSHSEDFENRIPAEATRNLSSYFSIISKEFKEENSEFSLTIKSYLNLMLISLIRDFNYADDCTSLNRDLLHRMRRITTYIDTHLSDSLSLTKLAEISGWTPNYLSALFHKISGISLWEYINAKRIDVAIQLVVAEQPMNMLDIAIRCGFNNTANFNKCFRKVTGMTPTEYRKMGTDI